MNSFFHKNILMTLLFYKASCYIWYRPNHYYLLGKSNSGQASSSSLAMMVMVILLKCKFMFNVSNDAMNVLITFLLKLVLSIPGL